VALVTFGRRTVDVVVLVAAERGVVGHGRPLYSNPGDEGSGETPGGFNSVLGFALEVNL
jgi:hypothetical protein